MFWGVSGRGPPSREVPVGVSVRVSVGFSVPVPRMWCGDRWCQTRPGSGLARLPCHCSPHHMSPSEIPGRSPPRSLFVTRFTLAHVGLHRCASRPSLPQTMRGRTSGRATKAPVRYRYAYCVAWRVCVLTHASRSLSHVCFVPNQAGLRPSQA